MCVRNLGSLPSIPIKTELQSTGFESPASCIELALVIYFTYGNIHVSVLFSQIIPPSPSPTESKSLVFTSVLLLMHGIWQKPPQYCKVIILQLKLIIFFFLKELQTSSSTLPLQVVRYSPSNE